MKKNLALLVIFILLSITSYYTHRLWIFAGKVSKGFEYTYAAIDCLIQENGQSETDIDILFKGYKSREAYVKAVNKKYPGTYDKDNTIVNRTMYNTQIPECKIFYTQYRCWQLDPHDPKSLDGCGKHFGLTQEEIDIMKKDPSSIKRIIDDWVKRGQKK